MDLTALGLFAAALLVNAGSPGPSIAALVARVIARGLGSVLPFLIAMWFGEILWLLAAVFGLGFLAAKFYMVFTVIKYLGVAYLLFLAWKMWTAPVVLSDTEMPDDKSALNLFLTGLALTLGNPKIMVFYLALLPTLIDIKGISGIGIAELAGVALLVMMAVDLTWAWFAAWARTWLRSPKAIRIANRTSAAAMTGAALVIATR
jgi:threonine/homoserine/homoserine lactone efflux protein